MEWYNYLEIPTYLPTGYKYMYVDIAENYSKGLFQYEEIDTQAQIVGYDTEDTPYVLMECDIHETEKDKFESAMDQLTRRMAFEGHRDYLKACRRIFGFEDA